MEILVVRFSNRDGHLWMKCTHLAVDNDEDDEDDVASVEVKVIRPN